MLKMLQEPVLILKLHSFPGCHTSIPASFLKDLLSYPHPRGVWKTSPGKKKQKKKNNNKNLGWIPRNSSSWLASSTSKYILPLLMPPFRSLKFFTPLFRSPCAELFAAYPCSTLPPVPGSSYLPSLIYSGPLVLLNKALTGQALTQNQLTRFC